MKINHNATGRIEMFKLNIVAPQEGGWARPAPRPSSTPADLKRIADPRERSPF